MADKNILWQGVDFVEKIENVIEKIAWVLVIVLLICAYVVW